MSKKIPLAGARTRSVERRLWHIACQPCPFRDGCGTCVSHWETGCRELHYVSSHGRHRKTRHSCCRCQNPHQKSMVRGNWPQREAEPVVKLPGRRLCGKRMGTCAVAPER